MVSVWKSLMLIVRNGLPVIGYLFFLAASALACFSQVLCRLRQDRFDSRGVVSLGATTPSPWRLRTPFQCRSCFSVGLIKTILSQFTIVPTPQPFRRAYLLNFLRCLPFPSLNLGLAAKAQFP